MEFRNIKKTKRPIELDDTEEKNMIPIKRNRTSILKQHKETIDDQNYLRLSRRVSFSSFYIKPFSTDDDRNTVWDSTIEEMIDQTESTHSDNSSKSETSPFNVSSFGNILDCSDSFDEKPKPHKNEIPVFEEHGHESYKAAFGERNIALSDRRNSRSSEEVFLIDKKLITANSRENDIIAEKENIISIQLRHEAKEKLKLPIVLSFEKSKKTARGIVTAANEKKGQTSSSTLAYNSVTEMDLTCEYSKGVLLNDGGGCKEPGKGNIQRPESMNKNRIAPSCVPVLEKNNIRVTCGNASDTLNESANNMELTCTNPVLNSKNFVQCSQDVENDFKTAALSYHTLNESVNNMELTCTNPVLNSKNNVQCIQDVDNDSKTTDRLYHTLNESVNNMEFTCTNPVLNSKNNEQCSQDVENDSKTTGLLYHTLNESVNNMEFTCTNPVLNSNTLNESVNNMEFTCTNPVLNSKNTLQCSQDVKDEFKTTAPSYHTLNESVNDLEFTCTNPVLNSNTLNESVNNLEFTCTNPVLNSKNTLQCSQDVKDEFKITAPSFHTLNESVNDLEFTCTNSVLNSKNTLQCSQDVKDELKTTASSYHTLNESVNNLEFTCTNPVLDSKKIVQCSQDVENDSKTTAPSCLTLNESVNNMEFTCTNPVLNSKNFLHCSQDVGDYPKTAAPSYNTLNQTANIMELTCTNPDFNSRTLEENVNVMELTLGSPVLNSRILNESVNHFRNDMEFRHSVINSRKSVQRSQNVKTAAPQTGTLEKNNEEMESTIPVLNSGTLEKNNEEIESTSPVLNSGTLEKNNEEIESTSPVLNSRTLEKNNEEIESTSPVRNSRTLEKNNEEIESTSPVLNSRTLKKSVNNFSSTLKANADEIEFTCQVLNSSVTLERSLQPIEGACENIVCDSGTLEKNNEEMASTSAVLNSRTPEKNNEEMESTSPVLNSRTLKKSVNNSSSTLKANADGIEFTCTSPIFNSMSFERSLQPIEGACENVVCDSGTLEKNNEEIESTSPLLNSRTLEKNNERMESTSPVLNSRTLEKNNEKMESTSPVINSRTLKKSVNNFSSTLKVNADDSEYTCTSPMFNSTSFHKQSILELNPKNITDPTLPNINLTLDVKSTETNISTSLAPSINRSQHVQDRESIISQGSGLPSSIYLDKQRTMLASKPESFHHSSLPISSSDSIANTSNPTLVFTSTVVSEDKFINLEQSEMASEQNNKYFSHNSNVIMENSDLHPSITLCNMSPCTDDTQLLLASASRLHRLSLSKSYVNTTYIVAGKDSEEFEEDKQDCEVEDTHNTEDTKDYLAKYRSEKDISLIDRDSSIILVDTSNDSEMVLSSVNREMKFPIHSEETPQESSEMTGGTNFTSKFRAIREKAVRKLIQKQRFMNEELQLFHEEFLNKLKIQYRRNDELRNKCLRKNHQLREKMQVYTQYQNEVKKELMNFDLIDVEMHNTETISESTSDESTENMSILAGKIEDRFQMKGCLWKFVKISTSSIQFITLYKKLELNVEFNPLVSTVLNLHTKSLLSDEATPIAWWLQREMLLALRPDYMKKYIGTNYTVLSLLDYIQMIMEKINKYYMLHKKLEVSHQLVMDKNFRVQFVVLDADLVLKWRFSVDLSDFEKSTADMISVSAVIGDLNKKEILKLFEDCPKDMELIPSFFQKLDIYLDVLKKRKRLIRTKKNVGL